MTTISHHVNSLTPGSRAPEFALPDQKGRPHTLSEYRGGWVLLYFYPKDDTPGCTKEACAVRDAMPDFKKLGIMVLGVSVDSVESHAKFAEKYDLPFTLLADEEKTVVSQYDVWAEKSFAGKAYQGTLRTSFLIDPDGKIAKVYKNVKPETHAEEVLRDMKNVGRCLTDSTVSAAQKGVLGLIFITALFVSTSLLAQAYDTELRTLIGHYGSLGILAYIALTIIAVVAAPFSALPLIPIASATWGWMATALFSILGWTIGSQIAFLLARFFGMPFVQKFASIKKLFAYQERLATPYVFWTVVFLRMVVPVDVLSYALGLFSRMHPMSYFFATLIGVTPFAFLFAYAGTLSILFQVMALVAGLAIAFIGYIVHAR